MGKTTTPGANENAVGRTSELTGNLPPSRAGLVASACAQHPDIAPIIKEFYRHIPAEDLPPNVDELVDDVTAHVAVATQRAPGQSLVHLANSRGPRSHNWTSLDVVTDDMPHLVDAVVGTLTSHGITVYRVLHPIMSVRRDRGGQLVDVLGCAVGTPGQRTTPGQESWMHLNIERLNDAERGEVIQAAVRTALDDVRAVVGDGPEIAQIARSVAAAIAAQGVRAAAEPGQQGRDSQQAAEAADLLLWAAEGNMVLLGYRCHEYDPATAIPVIVPDSGLGLLGQAGGGTNVDLTDSNDVLAIAQASVGTSINQSIPPLTISITQRRADGSAEVTHHFLALLSPRAYTAPVQRIPVVRRLVTTVLTALAAAPGSFNAEQALAIVGSGPREELFWADPNRYADMVARLVHATSRRRARAFTQPDPHGRFVSAAVFLARDRWTTSTRLIVQRVLTEELGGTLLRYATRVGDSDLAAVYMVIATDPGAAVITDEHLDEIISTRLRRDLRTWDDLLVESVVGSSDTDAAGARARYTRAFDDGYKANFPVEDAVIDLAELERLTEPGQIAIRVTTAAENAPADRQLKLYSAGAQISLSRALPVLASLGAEVIAEHPYQVKRIDGVDCYIYDFGLRFVGKKPCVDEQSADYLRFAEAFHAIWDNRSEIDGLNRLVLDCGLSDQQVTRLRAFSRYYQQIGTPYAARYIEQVLRGHADITRQLAHLFDLRFDPARPQDSRERETQTQADAIAAALEAVTSLDADRILRTFLHITLACERTNAYQSGPRPALAFKLTPSRIPGVPKPVPLHEIWVYSPRMEGVHLRFGDIARGGLRWSDRPEDFRTEILGLVKAQEVKNAVIVPVGAKGGFVVRRPPKPTGDVAADRKATLDEGIACYRSFISSMLAITDNRRGSEVLAPAEVVRHDNDDPYLVVAADKGTASFSDIANKVAAEHGFWLGDAFASGGSVGYDHKGMAITARGAWESVKSHFRELGIDTQTQEFTAIGIGDMSGDVFGNGMLLSQHLRLVAAFDHRHIFIDPNPDAATGFAERLRLFALPRSSWADYDLSLISPGGGVFPRTVKSIAITEQMRTALGLAAGVTALPPVELIRAILIAPVDLLWNGGIGTYVKAGVETNAQVGDKANDGVRVNGADLRVRVVGEGGNLGLTQLGRIEFALAGGHINTDAIDNSGGVDCSDHEVNMKIALAKAVEAGQLDATGRSELLTSMTDEVADLVLRDNVEHNRLLGVARAQAPEMIHVHGRLIDDLVAHGGLDRALEYLPDSETMAARGASGIGLTSPEISVIVAYVTSKLARELQDSSLPDDPVLRSRLTSYFPHSMREIAAAGIDEHPLAKAIVTTMTANDVVNTAGASFIFRACEELNVSAVDVVAAYTVAVPIFGIHELNAAIAATDNVVPVTTQHRLMLMVRRLLDRAVRWLVTHRPQPLDMAAEIDRYTGPLAQLMPRVSELLGAPEQATIVSDVAALVEIGAPEELARQIVHQLDTFGVLDVIDIHLDTGVDLDTVASVYFGLSTELEVDRLLTAVSALPRTDRWRTLARSAVRQDLYLAARQLTTQVVQNAPSGMCAADALENWRSANAGPVARARQTLSDMHTPGLSDLAVLSVAARALRSLVH